MHKEPSMDEICENIKQRYRIVVQLLIKSININSMYKKYKGFLLKMCLPDQIGKYIIVPITQVTRTVELSLTIIPQMLL